MSRKTAPSEITRWAPAAGPARNQRTCRWCSARVLTGWTIRSSELIRGFVCDVCADLLLSHVQDRNQHRRKLPLDRRLEALEKKTSQLIGRTVVPGTKVTRIMLDHRLMVAKGMKPRDTLHESDSVWSVTIGPLMEPYLLEGVGHTVADAVSRAEANLDALLQQASLNKPARKKRK